MQTCDKGSHHSHHLFCGETEALTDSNVLYRCWIIVSTDPAMIEMFEWKATSRLWQANCFGGCMS